MFFTYSERDNTKALEIKPVVPVAERHKRNKILRNLSYSKNATFHAIASWAKRAKVLFESQNKNGMMEGYSDNYIKVIVSLPGKVRKQYS